MAYNSYNTGYRPDYKSDRQRSNKAIEQIITDDGTPTLLLTGINETYHSRHGALAESNHVYVGMGMYQLMDLLYLDIIPDTDEINIFEMGFGTGLNAFLAATTPVLNHRGKKLKVKYTGVDIKALDHDILENYVSELDLTNEERSYFKTIIDEPWIPMDDLDEGEFRAITPDFSFRKIETDIRDYLADRYERKTANYHLVFWDAFGPKKQPQLWDKWIFKRMYDMMADKSMIVTYSAATAVQRGLLDAGMKLEKTPGPPNKREMLRAYKLK